MTDRQTLQWWIDHATELEQQLDKVLTRSRLREQRIIDAVMERNSALANADRWKRACHTLAQQASALPQHQHTSTEQIMQDAYAQAMRDD